MNEPRNQSLNITGLLIAAQENRLTSDQLEYWNHLLETDPDALDAYLEHVSLESTLQHAFQTAINVGEPEDITPLHQALTALGEPKTPIQTLPPRTPIYRRRIPLVRYAAAALIFVLCLIALFTFAHLRNAPTHEHLAASALLAAELNADWDTAHITPGNNLPAGPLSLRRGLAKITLPTGTTLLLQAPVELEFTSDSNCQLHSGTLTAHVPPAAIGFSVTTPQATITDLGTEFGIYVTDTGHTHAEVFTGKVQVSTSRAPAQILEANHAVQINADALAITPTPLEPLAFLRPSALNHLPSQSTTDPAYAAWLAFSTQLRNLPETTAYYAFDNQTEAPDKLLNRAAASLGHDDGEIDHATWAPGRFSSKPSLYFDGDTSGVKLAVPDTLRGFTLAAWINFEDLKRHPDPRIKESQFAAIFASDDTQSPAIDWMINRGSHAILRFSPTNPASAGYRRYDSPPAINAVDCLHRWAFLAVTLDPNAKIVTHYLNGKSIGANPLVNEDQTSCIGAAQIGSWAPYAGGSAHPRRGFNGRIDELVILSRPLTSREIQSIYAAGNIDQ
jgi:hypothetical protein